MRSPIEAPIQALRGAVAYWQDIFDHAPDDRSPERKAQDADNARPGNTEAAMELQIIGAAATGLIALATMNIIPAVIALGLTARAIENGVKLWQVNHNAYTVRRGLAERVVFP